MTGQACPECGGRRPGCACARAERAAAEDFDPLRIRPYVTLDAQEGAAAEGGTPGRPGSAAGEAAADEAGDPPTAQLMAIRPPYGAAPSHDASGAGGPVPYGHDGHDAHAPGPTGETLSGQGFGGQSFEGQGFGGQSLDGQGFDGPGWDGHDSHAPDGFAPYGSEGGAHETMPLLLGGVGAGDAAAGTRRGRSRGRRGGLVAGIAAAAVVGTAALAAAVLGGEEPEDRATVPEVTTSASLNIAVSEEPSPSSATPTPTRTPSRTPSPDTPSPSAAPSTASPSASAEPTARPTATAAPTATGGTTPSRPATSAPAPPVAPTTASATPSTTDAPEGATLSLGDTGPEVEELQTRLRLLWVYLEEADGVFDEGLQAALIQYQGRFWQLEDPEGVYGPDTRRKLEQQTKNLYR
ncbi:hypothetical protein GCM10017562_24210 [Streptomyces roseofulvus]|uniref:peptidoglycan-binding domain-containing protein n=1 Tax=Streptomyces roseofulvus TaxID=33902 RepID=UPI0031F8D4EE